MSGAQITADTSDQHALRTAEAETWRKVALRAAEQYGTPCYITRWRPIARAVHVFDRLEIASPGVSIRSWLSFKTHPLPQLVHRWLQTGRGVEVVSEAELAIAQRFDPAPHQLLVNGVAKHAWLIRHRIPDLHVHLDSTGELEPLLPLALECGWKVGVRVHAPDERDARDAGFAGQFGMTPDEAVASLRRLRDAGARVDSVHFHLGQGPQSSRSYTRGVERLADVCDAAEVRPRIVDLGGGHRVVTDPESDLRGLRAGVAMACERFAPELEEIWLENGRAVSEASSVLAVRVLDIKERADSRYLICDGGRTNHALAADAGLHGILTVPSRSGAPRLTTICGPTCMTDDRLGRLHLPEGVAVGDVLVWTHAGAYHLPWETRFSGGLCAVVWCDEDDRMSLARDHERADGWGHTWGT